MKKVFTKSEIIVQGPDQDSTSFRNEINKIMEELCLSGNVASGINISSSASSTGRMTVILYWTEIVW